MEPSPLSIQTSSFPVDAALIYERLRALASTKEILHEKSTNFLILECETLGLVREAYDTRQTRYEVGQDLLKLWFPSLSRGADVAHLGWGHFWDLDLEVEKILNMAKYPDQDPKNDEMPDVVGDSSTFPVDTALINKRLHALASTKELYEESMNFPILECATLDLVWEAYDLRQDRYEVGIDLLNIWFPSLCRQVHTANLGWSQLGGLDLKVEEILKTAKYPAYTEDDDSSQPNRY